MTKYRLLFISAIIPTLAIAQPKVETLSRGVVALPCEKGNFVSWRLLSTDTKDVTFDVIRDGKVIASDVKTSTSITDVKGTAESTYVIRTNQNGRHEDSTPVKAWAQPYLSLPLNRPADGTTPDGKTYSYSPNDCSCGDVDADGNYEIILKWDPSNSHDNAHDRYTGNVLLDCYTLTGEQLWRIDLGCNIRAGAHYTQFLVYDFDGDGKAELICKTAPGSKDGKGRFVTEAATEKGIQMADNAKSYVERNGRIFSGPEYLTVFSGEDGHAIHTIYYNPTRAFNIYSSSTTAEEKEEFAKGFQYDKDGWGDGTPGNRGERFLAGVAYLGSNNASAVMCRGYYTRSYLWAVDFDGKELSTRWIHKSENRHAWAVEDKDGKVILQSKEDLKSTAFAQGAHSLAVGDVDNDGLDEITYGSAAIDHDGSLLYSTGLGHGDAQHLGDLDPDRPGLEYYMVHEERPAGYDLRDARTGEILLRETDTNDTGRGLAADIDPNHRGFEFWCSTAKKVHAINGNVICETEGWTPQNFRIYWDGDLQDELIGNGGSKMKPGTWTKGAKPTYYIAKWNGSGCDHVKINGKDLSDWGNSASCNGTKATPCLQADLFGDWREELVLFDASDKAHLNIFTTNIPTEHRIPTLMHDHIYRMGVAWQNTAYNQPPHLGYSLVPLPASPTGDE